MTLMKSRHAYASAHSGIYQGLVVEHEPSLLPAAHGPEGARQRPTRPPGRARPWFLEPAVRSGVLTGAPCPSPFAPPTLAGPHQVPEPCSWAVSS